MRTERTPRRIPPSDWLQKYCANPRTTNLETYPAEWTDREAVEAWAMTMPFVIWQKIRSAYRVHECKKKASEERARLRLLDPVHQAESAADEVVAEWAESAPYPWQKVLNAVPRESWVAIMLLAQRAPGVPPGQAIAAAVMRGLNP